MKKVTVLVSALALWLPSLTCFAASVSDAKLGNDVIDREISGETTTFGLNEKAFLWMRIADGAGENITVTWSNGDQSWDVQLSIGSDAWRTWSSKNLHLPGDWTVTVTDASGTSLHQATLTVQ